MIRRLLSTAALLIMLNTSAAAPVKELVALQHQYAFLIAERVTAPFETGVAALNEKFLVALASAGDDAKKAGKLAEVLAIEEDKKLIQSNQPLPERDDETTSVAQMKLRAVYRAETARLSAQRSAAEAALLPAYGTKLQDLESTLTKGDRLDEAKEVMQYREGLGIIAVPAAVGSQYTNGLGMKFVKVPDTQVLFCIHEVRRQDYAVYAGAVSGVDATWKTASRNGIPTSDQADHPVAGVNWQDAQDFCSWLSKREGRTYRLPTDKEWSCAVGLGYVENWAVGSTPETLDCKVLNVYPWGNEYPPKGKGKGNYADITWGAKFASQAFLKSYTDDFATASPVMSFKPNKLGIYDLGGNVWEWVQEQFNPTTPQHALRGASWDTFTSNHTLSSSRIRNSTRRHDYGFRVVIEEKGR